MDFDRYLDGGAYEEVAVGTCAGCGREIYEGEDIIQIDEHMCHDDGDCIREMLFAEFGAEEKTAEREI